MQSTDVAAWQARWIQAPWSTERDGAEVADAKLEEVRPMPIFRREFTLRAQPVKAMLRIVGLGQWTATLGSQGRVRAVRPPGLHGAWTDYRKTVVYDTVDVTALLRPGTAVLGVMLGNGMYNVQRSQNPKPAKGTRYTKFEGSFGVPKLIAELRVRYRDGRTEVIGTDARWKAARGPVIFDSTFGGEDYDARRETRGWEAPRFDDAAWQAAKVVDGPGGALTLALAPPVGQHETHAPVRTTEVGAGRTVYDLGQNFAGVATIRVTGPAGATLRLTPGELLNADGTVSQRSSGGPMWWSYTLRGTTRGDTQGETWMPLFGYYGFRYVQAEWMTPEKGALQSLAGIAIHTDAAEVGSFETSSPILNAIHKLIVEAMHNNEVSLFTDCPHREKLGWLEETHLVAPGILFNNDVEGLYRATDRNMADAQQASGLVPTIAPQYTKFGPAYAIYDDSPEWGSAVVLAPWAAYRFYGDKAELERMYPAMAAWVRYLNGRAQDGIVSYGLGDWYDIGPKEPGFSQATTAGVTGTLMLYETSHVMEQIARLLGKDGDAENYRVLAQATQAAFQRHFWDAEHRWYDRGSQTANAMPLALGLVPEQERAAVLAQVVADIHAHQDHVTAGEVGYPYLLRALMGAGRDDVVLAMLLRKDAPSYGSQLQAGATALTEAWDANPKNSQDHLMLGAAEEWFYRGLGGVDVDFTRTESAERLTLRPIPVAGVDWVRCGYRSKFGQVESDWKREGVVTTFDMKVPVEAMVVLPLRTGGASVKGLKRAGVRELDRQAGSVRLRVKAGTYRFVVT